MKKMGRFNVYTLDECMDAQLGEKGTPERDEFEREVEEARQAWLMGKAIKEARKKRNLTQEQLGKMIGVGKSRVSLMESGHNLTLASLLRIFKALGAGSCTLDLGAGFGKVSLW